MEVPRNPQVKPKPTGSKSRPSLLLPPKNVMIRGPRRNVALSSTGTTNIHLPHSVRTKVTLLNERLLQSPLSPSAASKEPTIKFRKPSVDLVVSPSVSGCSDDKWTTSSSGSSDDDEQSHEPKPTVVSARRCGQVLKRQKSVDVLSPDNLPDEPSLLDSHIIPNDYTHAVSDDEPNTSITQSSSHSTPKPPLFEECTEFSAPGKSEITDEHIEISNNNLSDTSKAETKPEQITPITEIVDAGTILSSRPDDPTHFNGKYYKLTPSDSPILKQIGQRVNSSCPTTPQTGSDFSENFEGNKDRNYGSQQFFPDLPNPSNSGQRPLLLALSSVASRSTEHIPPITEQKQNSPEFEKVSSNKSGNPNKRSYSFTVSSPQQFNSNKRTVYYTYPVKPVCIPNPNVIVAVDQQLSINADINNIKSKLPESRVQNDSSKTLSSQHEFPTVNAALQPLNPSSDKIYTARSDLTSPGSHFTESLLVPLSVHVQDTVGPGLQPGSVIDSNTASTDSGISEDMNHTSQSPPSPLDGADSSPGGFPPPMNLTFGEGGQKSVDATASDEEDVTVYSDTGSNLNDSAGSELSFLKAFKSNIEPHSNEQTTNNQSTAGLDTFLRQHSVKAEDDDDDDEADNDINSDDADASTVNSDLDNTPRLSAAPALDSNLSRIESVPAQSTDRSSHLHNFTTTDQQNGHSEGILSASFEELSEATSVNSPQGAVSDLENFGTQNSERPKSITPDEPTPSNSLENSADPFTKTNNNDMTSLTNGFLGNRRNSYSKSSSSGSDKNKNRNTNNNVAPIGIGVIQHQASKDSNISKRSSMSSVLSSSGKSTPTQQNGSDSNVIRVQASIERQSSSDTVKRPSFLRSSFDDKEIIASPSHSNNNTPNVINTEGHTYESVTFHESANEEYSPARDSADDDGGPSSPEVHELDSPTQGDVAAAAVSTMFAGNSGTSSRLAGLRQTRTTAHVSPLRPMVTKPALQQRPAIGTTPTSSSDFGLSRIPSSTTTHSASTTKPSRYRPQSHSPAAVKPSGSSILSKRLAAIRSGKPVDAATSSTSLPGTRFGSRQHSASASALNYSNGTLSRTPSKPRVDIHSIFGLSEESLARRAKHEVWLSAERQKVTDAERKKKDDKRKEAQEAYQAWLRKKTEDAKRERSKSLERKALIEHTRSQQAAQHEEAEAAFRVWLKTKRADHRARVRRQIAMGYVPTQVYTTTKQEADAWAEQWTRLSRHEQRLPSKPFIPPGTSSLTRFQNDPSRTLPRINRDIRSISPNVKSKYSSHFSRR